MKVKVKTVKQEVFDVELDAGMKVSEIKAAIESQVGDDKFRRDLLQIVFKGKRWTEDDATIEQMGVTEGCVIVVVVKQPAKAAPAPASAAPAAGTMEAAPPPAPALTTASAEGTEVPAEGSATGADAFATGSELQASIRAITEMGFEEAQVKRAMRAAFNNPERAVEYLMTGIPAGLEPPAAQPGAAPAAQAPATQPAAVTPAPAAAPAQNPTSASGPNAAPLDMWGGGGGGAAAATPAAPGGGMNDLLSQLRGSPNAAQRIQQMLANDPNQLAAMLQDIARSNPEIAQQLASNPGAFLEALSSMGGGEGGAPPGTVTVELTPDDNAAVGRLEALGFSRMACIQAYIACERSEELAANYLLENATDEDMQ